MNAQNSGTRDKLGTLGQLIEKNVNQLRKRLLSTEHVHFLHVGKTGGTALVHAFRNFPPTGNRIFTLHGHITTLTDIPVGEKVVFVLRNPPSRFVSGFNSRLREGKHRYNAPWTDDERIAFERFPCPNGLAEAIRSEVPQERAAAEHAMNTIIHVSDRYSKWFGSLEYLMDRQADIKFIGFQETLSDDFEKLKTVLGIPNNATLPSDEISAHKTPEGLRKKLSAKAEENLRHWYAEDFEYLRYAHSLMEAKSGT